MKVMYKKKAVPKDPHHKRSRGFQEHKKPKPTLQSAKSRTVVRVTAVPRRTVRGC